MLERGCFFLLATTPPETPVPRLVVLYPVPSDVPAFEKAFREEHEPLIRAQLAGVRSVTASKVSSTGDQPVAYHWMAELGFDSMDALTRAMRSDGGLRTGAHARQISSGGAPVIFAVDDAASAPQPVA